jgi:IS5 family transposase
VKPVDWPEDMHWRIFTIDTSCSPADLTYPTDLELLNEARKLTYQIIDDLIEKQTGLGVHRPRYDRGKARVNLQISAKQKLPRRCKITAAIRR